MPQHDHPDQPAPAAARPDRPVWTPASTATIPRFRASARTVATRSETGGVRSSAAAKCSLQTTMALVAAPSSTRCRASQPPPATRSPGPRPPRPPPGRPARTRPPAGAAAPAGRPRGRHRTVTTRVGVEATVLVSRGRANGPGALGRWTYGRAGEVQCGWHVRALLPEAAPAADLVEQALVDASPGWLASLSTAAQERGNAAPGSGSGAARGRFGQFAGVDPGREDAGSPWSSAAVHLPTMTWLPLRWEPLGVDGLLPRLDATIELGSLGQDRTQLAISAQFEPPSGPSQDIDPRHGSPGRRSHPRTSSTSWVMPSS